MLANKAGTWFNIYGSKITLPSLLVTLHTSPRWAEDNDLVVGEDVKNYTTETN